MSEETFVYTACPGWGDHECCTLKTIVKDGKIIRTEPVTYTGAEKEEGYICSKGAVSCRNPYNPDRLTVPLKRVGERGEGKWQEISWGQALDEIAAKLNEIKEKYGPQAVVGWNLQAAVPPNQGLNGMLAQRLTYYWGMTDPIMSIGLDNGCMLAEEYTHGDIVGLYNDPRVLHDTDYILVWGMNPIENQARLANHLVEARERGAKIVDIGLIFDATAGFADEFYGAKGGSDAAVALAMCKLIIDNEWHDVNYLVAHSDMPLLIRKDDGNFYKDSDNNYYVWSTKENRAVPAGKSPHAVTEGILLEGEFDVDGIACETVFSTLLRHLKSYSLEMASELSSISIEDIKHITKEYAQAESSYILSAMGLRYRNSGDMYRAFKLLAILTGQIGRPESGCWVGIIPSCYPVTLNDYAIMRPDGKENEKTKYIRTADFFEECEKTDNYKALIKFSGNPVHNYPNRPMWLDTVFPGMELIVDFDIWMTDTGEVADYVLPDCMSFERTDIIVPGPYGHVVLQEKAIEPPAGCRDSVFFISELAKRLGLGEFFDKTADEWLEFRLQTDYPFVADIKPPLTLERLKKEKMVRMAAPDAPFSPRGTLEVGTDSGRLQAYVPVFKEVGHALPVYEPPMETPTLVENKTYPYQFFSGRQRFFMQSAFVDDEIMIGLSGGKPAIRMNPVTATKEGLATGDRVEVYNQRGHLVAPLYVDEAVPPNFVHAWFGWRKRQFEEGSYSELVPPCGGREAVDDYANAWHDDAIKEYESVYCGSVSYVIGAWDTLWDCACAVRKAVDRKEA